MLISIGILAWNEENNIKNTLTSLFQQSVFSQAEEFRQEYNWEIIIIPNGCSDSTARIARDTLSNYVSTHTSNIFSWHVIELVQPGKSNAWNKYIHEHSNQSAELIILIDADIQFGHERTIENVISTINASPHADVVVDLPLKNTLYKKNKSLLDKASHQISEITFESPPGICGQFYCARGKTLRNIWMPVGLSGEDVFLRSMIITDLFRSEVDEKRIIRAKDANHYYEAESTITSIFRHQVRMVIGTALNCYLTWDGLKFMTDPTGPGAGILIKNLVDNDKNWYPKYINSVIANRSWWVLPRGMLLGRFSMLRGASGARKVKKAIVIMAGLLFDIPAFLMANHKIKSGKSVGYW